MITIGPMPLLAVAVLSLIHRPQAVDTYGKTEAQILHMGQDAWFKFYTAHAGDSTAAMNNASGIYADLAAARNEKLLANPKLKNRAGLKKLEKLLVSFGGDMVSVGYVASGGGTMWSQIGAQAYADAEDTVYWVMRPSEGPRVKPNVVSAVKKEFSLIPKKIEAGVKDGFVTAEKRKSALGDLASCIAEYGEITKIAAEYDRKTSDRILNFCLDRVKVVNEF